LDEKTILNDLIINLKSNINLYETSICNSENISLRQILQQMRNNNENLLYEINKISKIKGYIKTSENAESREIDTVKNESIW